MKPAKLAFKMLVSTGFKPSNWSLRRAVARNLKHVKQASATLWTTHKVELETRRRAGLLSLLSGLLRYALTRDLKIRETGFYDFMKTSMMEIGVLSSTGLISPAKRAFKATSSAVLKDTRTFVCEPEYVHVSICDVRVKEVCIYIFVSMFT